MPAKIVGCHAEVLSQRPNQSAQVPDRHVPRHAVNQHNVRTCAILPVAELDPPGGDKRHALFPRLAPKAVMEKGHELGHLRVSCLAASQIGHELVKRELSTKMVL